LRHSWLAAWTGFSLIGANIFLNSPCTIQEKTSYPGLNTSKQIIGHRVEFFGREHRGASDEVNSLLNYGYGILYSQVWGAVLNAGLEPFAGFLHVDRPGKPSLVLDLVEEFRQPVVDRSVIAYVNLGISIGMKDGLLDADTRKSIGERVVERLYASESYHGKQYQIRSIIQMQARRLAGFLRGNGGYKAFSFKW
jgi:CRISP-associated protein Cas1